jgi:hypothetical protein
MSRAAGWLRLTGTRREPLAEEGWPFDLVDRLGIGQWRIPMKYITIIYGNKDLWQSFTPEQAGKAIAEVDAFNRRHKESGELLGAYGLGDELTAKTVRVRDGVPAVTDGPYIEAKEFVSSFFLLDVDSEDRALEIAAEYPFAAHNAVEVWPILHESGPEL